MSTHHSPGYRAERGGKRQTAMFHPAGYTRSKVHGTGSASEIGLEGN